MILPRISGGSTWREGLYHLQSSKQNICGQDQLRVICQRAHKAPNFFGGERLHGKRVLGGFFDNLYVQENRKAHEVAFLVRLLRGVVKLLGRIPSSKIW